MLIFFHKWCYKIRLLRKNCLWTDPPAESSPGTEPLVRGSGGKAPKAESFEVFALLKKAQKLLSICQGRLNMALTVGKKRYHT